MDFIKLTLCQHFKRTAKLKDPRDTIATEVLIYDSCELTLNVQEITGFYESYPIVGDKKVDQKVTFIILTSGKEIVVQESAEEVRKRIDAEIQ